MTNNSSAQPQSAAIMFVNGGRDFSRVVFDRAFAYGDGLFETMRGQHGSIPLIDYHLERLQRGCAVLGLQYPHDLILQYLSQAIDESKQRGFDNVKVKLTLTRGEGGVATYPPKSQSPNIYIQVDALSSAPSLNHAVELVVSPVPLVSAKNLAGLKHLNRLAYIQSCLSIELKSGQEVAFVDERGHIVETMHHNLFLVRNNTLVTPKLDVCGVEGVMKRLTCEVLAGRVGLDVSSCHIPLDEIESFDEVFISNAVRGLSPVRAIDLCLFDRFDVCQKLSNEFKNY